MRNECENEINNKEHINISIRVNDKNKELLNTLKTEAQKNGYEISEAKEKDSTQKATDIVPWDSNWDKPERNVELKKRLKKHEKDPEPLKKKLPKDE